MKRKRNSIRYNDFFSIPEKNASCEDHTVDLHGMNCETAEHTVESVIQNACSNERILVIHGKGTGILKQHIRAFLNAHPRVKCIYLGEKEKYSGKSGVCVAVIK